MNLPNYDLRGVEIVYDLGNLKNYVNNVGGDLQEQLHLDRSEVIEGFGPAVTEEGARQTDGG